MVLATRVECNKEGSCDSNKGDSNKGGGQATTMRALAMAMAMAMAIAMAAMWAVAMVMRLLGDKEGKGKGGKGNGDDNVRAVGDEQCEGSKAMAIATWMAGKWTAMVTKRAMAMATRVAGEQTNWEGHHVPIKRLIIAYHCNPNLANLNSYQKLSVHTGLKPSMFIV
jgi:hypothetical protein